MYFIHKLLVSKRVRNTYNILKLQKQKILFVQEKKKSKKMFFISTIDSFRPIDRPSSPEHTYCSIPFFSSFLIFILILSFSNPVFPATPTAWESRHSRAKRQVDTILFIVFGYQANSAWRLFPSGYRRITQTFAL